MVRGKLIMALDGRGIGPKTRRQTSAIEGAQWYVYDTGPNYSNTYAITEFDEAGAAWLKARQEPGAAHTRTGEGEGQ